MSGAEGFVLLHIDCQVKASLSTLTRRGTGPLGNGIVPKMPARDFTAGLCYRARKGVGNVELADSTVAET